MKRTERQRSLDRRTLLKGVGATAAGFAVASAHAEAITAQDEVPVVGGTLRYGLNVEPRRMNQLNTTWMTDATQHLFSRLVTREPESGTYVPELATWEISEDGLTWTFTLREGVTFHSGDPLTSDAIAWWFEQARDPDGFYGFKGSFSAIDTITAVDPLTTIVTLSHPDANLIFILYTVYSSIHNPVTYEALGADRYGIEEVDGTGGFKLQEFTPGDKLVIVRNDQYSWPAEFVKNQGPPFLDAIEYRYIADASARSAAIEAGDLDIVVSPNLADVERLSQNANLTVITKPQPACRMVTFNCEKAPLDNKLVRQAFAHAVQRDPIVERLLFGQGVPAYSLVPPIFPDIFLEETATYFPFDIQAGRALLAQAGLTDEDGDGFVEFEGRVWEPEMLVTTDTELVTLAQVVQAQAAEIGVKLSISQIDLESLSAREGSGDFDVVTGFYLWDGPDMMYEWMFLSSNIGTTNASRLNDPAVDALIHEMQSTATLADRYEVAKKIQAAVHGDAVPLVPVYHPLDIYVMSQRVRGYEPNAFTIYPRMNDTWLA